MACATKSQAGQKHLYMYIDRQIYAVVFFFLLKLFLIKDFITNDLLIRNQEKKKRRKKKKSGNVVSGEGEKWKSLNNKYA